MYTVKYNAFSPWIWLDTDRPLAPGPPLVVTDKAEKRYTYTEKREGDIYPQITQISPIIERRISNTTRSISCRSVTGSRPPSPSRRGRGEDGLYRGFLIPIPALILPLKGRKLVFDHGTKRPPIALVMRRAIMKVSCMMRRDTFAILLMIMFALALPAAAQDVRYYPVPRGAHPH